MVCGSIDEDEDFDANVDVKMDEEANVDVAGGV